MNKSTNVGLKLVRKRRGYNQKEVSNGAGLSQTYLSQIECGERSPSSEMLDRLCGFYDVPRFVVEWMGIGEEDIPRENVVLYGAMREVFDKWIDEMFFRK